MSNDSTKNGRKYTDRLVGPQLNDLIMEASSSRSRHSKIPRYPRPFDPLNLESIHIVGYQRKPEFGKSRERWEEAGGVLEVNIERGITEGS